MRAGGRGGGGGRTVAGSAHLHDLRVVTRYALDENTDAAVVEADLRQVRVVV
jgi:hypothetical protein